jgi:hypothetical protein
LEKEVEKLGQTHDKLCTTESEIRTLKTFLTTKTALIEKHKKDLRETRLRVAELEEKDARRAVILADVLEKTARQYQQQLGQTPRSTRTSPVGKRWQVDFQTALVNDIRFAMIDRRWGCRGNCTNATIILLQRMVLPMFARAEVQLPLLPLLLVQTIDFMISVC